YPARCHLSLHDALPISGTFYHGMPGITDAADYRGFFQLGSPNWFGLDASGTNLASNGGYASTMQGYLGPLPNTFTLDCDFVIDRSEEHTSELQSREKLV